MKYELAKQLKDAGFPIVEHLNKSPENIDRGFYGLPYDKVYAPTLSELIEACGDDFVKLTRMTTGKEKWLAKGDKESKRHVRKSFGSTPEEAVAKLWLELNKK